MNLRPATFADLDLLRHWDEQPHAIASDPNDAPYPYPLFF
jgi:aminoglycoside 6'-N-acetyltransferase